MVYGSGVPTLLVLSFLRRPGALLHPAAVRRFPGGVQEHVLQSGESASESKRDIQRQIITGSAERRAGAGQRTLAIRRRPGGARSYSGRQSRTSIIVEVH